MSVFFDKVAQRLDKLDAADRRRQFRQLADEIGFFESVFDTLKEGVIVVSPGGDLLYANAAAEALTGNTEQWHREANIATYRRRRDIAERIMKALGCTFDAEQVGMFLWGRIPDSYDNVEQLTEQVLHEARVFITPGFIFGSNGERYIRISLCAKDERMEEALERIVTMTNNIKTTK